MPETGLFWHSVSAQLPKNDAGKLIHQTGAGGTLQPLPHLLEGQCDVWPIVPLVRQIDRDRTAAIERGEHPFSDAGLAECADHGITRYRPDVDAGAERQHHEQHDIERPLVLVAGGEGCDLDLASDIGVVVSEHMGEIVVDAGLRENPCLSPGKVKPLTW